MMSMRAEGTLNCSRYEERSYTSSMVRGVLLVIKNLLFRKV